MARLLIVEDNPELAALIASAARSRGHEASQVHSGAGAISTADREKPELAIVDLLLPDVSGKDVLLQLKERAIPAIAISGVYKGEKFAQEAVSDWGARSFFEKPFDMRALLDAIDQLVGIPEGMIVEEDDDALDELELMLEDVLPEQGEAKPASADPSVDLDKPAHLAPAYPDEDEVPTRISTIDQAALAKAPSEGDEPVTRPASVHEMGGLSGPATAPELAEEPTTAVKPPPPELLKAHAEIEAHPEKDVRAKTGEHDLPLPFASRDEVWSKPAGKKPTDAKPLPEWGHAGDLAQTAVPRLLTAYFQARHGGELKLRQGQVNKVVYFEEGYPVYAASNVAGERFARFCIRRGAITEAQNAQIAALVKEKNLRTGDAMVQLGLLTEARRTELLSEQVREIIWSTFAWKTGEYTFAPKRPARTDLVKLRVFPGNLILEGVQKTEPLISLRQKVPSNRRLFPSADPAYALNELALTGQQALLLAYADGSKTVEDLVTLTDLEEKNALATLLGLELLGVLQERRDENTRRRISFGL